MRVRIMLASALVLALAATVGVASPANAAGSSCKGYQTAGHDVRWAAFAGHAVRITYKKCTYRRIGQIGPVRWGIRGMHTVRLSLPSTGPASWGESVSVIRNPYHYSTSSKMFRYRFSIKQGHVMVPVKQNFDFELQVRRLRSPWARICFVGKACSSWQN